MRFQAGITLDKIALKPDKDEPRVHLCHPYLDLSDPADDDEESARTASAWYACSPCPATTGSRTSLTRAARGWCSSRCSAPPSTRPTRTHYR